MKIQLLTLVTVFAVCACGVVPDLLHPGTPAQGSSRPAQNANAVTPATSGAPSAPAGVATTPTAPLSCPVASATCRTATVTSLAVADASTAADANAFDPNGSMGIDPGQCPSCMTCTNLGFSPVQGCAKTIGTAEPCQSFCHVNIGTPVNYCNDPPTSGDHYPTPEHGLGEHVTPVARGNYVHSMEHGAIILLYNCPTGCAAELDVFRQVVAQRSGHKVIMTPDPLMQSTRFAATSWAWLYTFDTPDLASLLCFIDQHEGHGREDLPL